MNKTLCDRVMLLVTKLISKNQKMETEKYPLRLEPEIQRAVEEKRKGNYDSATEIYLDIFEREGVANVDIMAFLFKVLVCDEQFDIAFFILCLAKNELETKVGEKCITPFGMIDWKQTVYWNRYRYALNRVLHNDILELYTFAREMSGNPHYQFSRAPMVVLVETQIMLEDMKKFIGI